MCVVLVLRKKNILFESSSFFLSILFLRRVIKLHCRKDCSHESLYFDSFYFPEKKEKFGNLKINYIVGPKLSVLLSPVARESIVQFVYL